MERNSGTELARVHRAWILGVREVGEVGEQAHVTRERAVIYLAGLEEADGDVVGARKVIAKWHQASVA